MKNQPFRIIYLTVFVALTGCFEGTRLGGDGPAAAMQPVPTEEEIFYHLFQRSFFDTNGDAAGDLDGVTTKLDYLQDLGITSLLLLPLYPSDMYHNYFAYDFEGIDPEFGTMEDFSELVAAVHARGMKLYLDTEYQYVDKDHKWFRESVNNPASEYSGYLRYNGPGNTEPESVFLGITTGVNYDGNHFHITPANLSHDSVRAYITGQYKFWMDPNGDGHFEDGVDGFRIDHMMDDLDDKGIWTNLLADFWKPLIAELKNYNPDVKFIAEQAHWEDIGTAYFKEAGVDMVFGFRSMAVKSFDKATIETAFTSLNEATPTGKYQCYFLENHDMDRFASQSGITDGQLKLGAFINYLGKGIPMIYYGQELGMKGKRLNAVKNDGADIPNREAFEWYAEVEGPGMAIWYRDSGPWWDATQLVPHDGISLEEQDQDLSSLLNFYRKLFRIRKSDKAFTYGELAFVDTGNPAIGMYTRWFEDAKYLLAFNLSANYNKASVKFADLPYPATFDKPDLTWGSEGSSYAIADKELDLAMAPFGYLVIQLD